MPVLSTFYGLRITMNTFDNDRHHLPHIHVRYQGKKAVLEIPSGKVLAGNLPLKKITIGFGVD